MIGEKRKLTREEIAKREIGLTKISRVVSFFLTLIFIVIIFSVPIVQHVYEVYKNGISSVSIFPRNHEIFSLVPRLEDVNAVARSGSLQEGFNTLKQVNTRILRGINEYESSIENSAVISKWIISHVGSFLIGVFRAGNEKVYCGMDGWLFFRPDIDYLTGHGFLEPKVQTLRLRSGNEWQAPPQPDPLKAIVEFRNQLAERGIELIVLPAPAKSMIYPEKFSKKYNNSTKPLQNPSFEELKRKLKENGVYYFDASQILVSAKENTGKYLYLDTDTHWSPAGMEIVASGLAEKITNLDILTPSSQNLYKRNTVTVSNPGDIATMLNLPEKLHYNKHQEVFIRQVSTVENELWKPERTAEILFLGDSFANIFSLEGMGWGKAAGLVEQLSFELQLPIDTILMNDNGAFATREQLYRELNQGVDRLERKKIVIYEFAVRELAIGDWKTGMDLTVGQLRGNIHPQFSDLIVSGRIKAITRPPKPGTVPYKDCIVSICLTDVKDVAGVVEYPDILVYTWGLLDNKLQPGSLYKPGEAITLNLTSWESVQNEYGRYNRVELDDNTLLHLNSYWAVIDYDEKIFPDEPEEDETVFIAAIRDNEQDIHTDKEISADEPFFDFYKNLKGIITTLDGAGENTFRGKDGWMFFKPELRSLIVGQFWGEAAEKVSRSQNPAYADPLPAILDFKGQLDSVGVELIIVPVPAKSVIYSEMIPDAGEYRKTPVPERLDIHMKRFYDLLEENGVRVIDLVPVFLSERLGGKPDLFCRQDTHWSGYACEISAQILAENIRTQSWYGNVMKKTFQTETRMVEITGDLWNYLGDSTIEKEMLSLSIVGEKRQDSIETVEPWRESPVVLLGDSHCLVFHAGADMHARGAGLADHLAKELGFPVDLVAVRGSGATPARINLARRQDNLTGKKIVIWCFSVREFTESTDGWRVLPVIRR